MDMILASGPPQSELTRGKYSPKPQILRLPPLSHRASFMFRTTSRPVHSNADMLYFQKQPAFN